MLWDMHLCVFDVRLSFENRVRCFMKRKFSKIGDIVTECHPVNCK